MNTTPDLSKEFHPVPKPAPKQKKLPKPLNRMGKKTIAWKETREEIKPKFFAAGITSCEIKRPKICWGKNALTFAHPDKRKNIKPDELHIVVLACTPCHIWIEPRKDMPEIIARIIKARKEQPVRA